MDIKNILADVGIKEADDVDAIIPKLWELERRIRKPRVEIVDLVIAEIRARPIEAGWAGETPPEKADAFEGRMSRLHARLLAAVERMPGSKR